MKERLSILLLYIAIFSPTTVFAFNPVADFREEVLVKRSPRLNHTNLLTSALPSTLFYFNAGWNQQDQIRLDWKIINESAGDSFLVQKSTDDINYTTIGSMKCNGITGIPQYYSFIDSFPAKENNRYRLKMVAENGHVKYSPIVYVVLQQEGWDIAKVFPTPFSNELTIQLMSDKKIQAQVEFLDLMGNLVTARNLSCINGTNMIVFDQLGHLPSGVYHLRVTVAGKTIQQTLLKAH